MMMNTLLDVVFADEDYS